MRAEAVPVRPCERALIPVATSLRTSALRPDIFCKAKNIWTVVQDEVEVVDM